ncbi:OB-fold nucleic acid binding domain-containing protein [Thermococcus peptonophilus]|uniref:OB-fold nucleic acid binding domain-containing protein n=1 Tax=Thermococcus peptonophilus TaxID=53952 RepID=UPI00346611E1
MSYEVFDEKGNVETVMEEYNTIVFTLSDGTGKITVEAFGDDYEIFEEEFGQIEEGKKMLVFGYVDIDPDGSLRFIVSDAPHPQELQIQ